MDFCDIILILFFLVDVGFGRPTNAADVVSHVNAFGANTTEVNNLFYEDWPLSGTQTVLLSISLCVLHFLVCCAFYLLRVYFQRTRKAIYRPQDWLDKGAHPYIVSFVTGFQTGAGGKPTVSFQIIGSHARSRPYTACPYYYDDIQLFKTRCSVNFIIDTKASLGTIRKMTIRCTSSRQLQETWYLDHIEIFDMQRDILWYLPCDRWLICRDSRCEASLLRIKPAVRSASRLFIINMLHGITRLHILGPLFTWSPYECATTAILNLALTLTLILSTMVAVVAMCVHLQPLSTYDESEVTTGIYVAVICVPAFMMAVLAWLVKESKTRHVFSALIAQPGCHARLGCCASWQRRNDDKRITPRLARPGYANTSSNSDSSSISGLQVGRTDTSEFKMFKSARPAFSPPRKSEGDVAYSGRGVFGHDSFPSSKNSAETDGVLNITTLTQQPGANSDTFFAVKTPGYPIPTTFTQNSPNTKQYTFSKIRRHESPEKQIQRELVRSSPPEKTTPVFSMERLHATTTGGDHNDTSKVQNLITMFTTNAICPLPPAIKQTTTMYEHTLSTDQRYRAIPYRSRVSNTSCVAFPALKIASEPFIGVQATIQKMKLLRSTSPPEQDDENKYKAPHRGRNKSRQLNDSRSGSTHHRPTRSGKDDDNDHHPRLDGDNSQGRPLDSEKSFKSVHGDKSNDIRVPDYKTHTCLPDSKQTYKSLHGDNSNQTCDQNNKKSQTRFPSAKSSHRCHRGDRSIHNRPQDDKKGNNDPKNKKSKNRSHKCRSYLENYPHDEGDTDYSLHNSQRESIIEAIKAMTKSQQTVIAASTDAIDRGHCLRPTDIGHVRGTSNKNKSAKTSAISVRTPLLGVPDGCGGSALVSSDEPELRGLAKIFKMFNKVRRSNAR